MEMADLYKGDKEFLRFMEELSSLPGSIKVLTRKIVKFIWIERCVSRVLRS